MTLSKAFIHLDAALRFPDPAWHHQMENLPVPLPAPRKRRMSSQLDGPWVAVISGPKFSGKTTLYRSRLARLWAGVPFVDTLLSAQDLVKNRQDFVWESGFLDHHELSVLNSWSLSGYKVGLIVLHPYESFARREQSASPNDISSSSPWPSQLDDLPQMVQAARAHIHAIWYLDSSREGQPPVVMSRWVHGSEVRL